MYYVNEYMCILLCGHDTIKLYAENGTKGHKAVAAAKTIGPRTTNQFDSIAIARFKFHISWKAAVKMKTQKKWNEIHSAAHVFSQDRRQLVYYRLQIASFFRNRNLAEAFFAKYHIDECVGDALMWALVEKPTDENINNWLER